MSVLYLMYCLTILNSRLLFSNGDPFMGFNVKQAEAHEFDFVVSISIKNYEESLTFEEENHICGGALITTALVLTSAHCICERIVQLEDYTVKIGHDLRNPEANFSIASWKSLKKCCCSLFRRGDVCNDIAVIKLTEDICSKISRNIVLPILKYSPMEQLYNQNASSAGWGDVTSKLKPRYMQKVTLTTISMEECLRNVNDVPRVTDSDTELRTKYILENNTLCSNGNRVPGVIPYTVLGKGDSGSPLVIENNQIIAVNRGSFPPEGPKYIAYEQSLHVALWSHRKFIKSQITDARRMGCFGRK